jgi:hypothetical protein
MAGAFKRLARRYSPLRLEDSTIHPIVLLRCPIVLLDRLLDRLLLRGCAGIAYPALLRLHGPIASRLHGCYC